MTNPANTITKRFQIVCNQYQYKVVFEDQQEVFVPYSEALIMTHPTDPNLFYLGYDLCLNYNLLTNFLPTYPSPPTNRKEVIDLLNKLPQISRNESITLSLVGETSNAGEVASIAFRIVNFNGSPVIGYANMTYLSVSTTCVDPIKVTIRACDTFVGGVWSAPFLIVEQNDLVGAVFTTLPYRVFDFNVKQCGMFVEPDVTSFPLVIADPTYPYVVQVDQRGQAGTTLVSIGLKQNPNFISY